MSKIGFFLLILLLVGCESQVQESNQLSFYQTQKENDTLFYLNIRGSSEKTAWELPYPVFQLDEGDVNNDGNIEALVGVIKKTRFDSIERKRLFIFKNHDGYVRPLWLGSRLSKPLINFCYFQYNNEGYILTMEEKTTTSFGIYVYQWNSFGLEYVKELF